VKQRLEPVHVETDPDGIPLRVIWRGRLYRVTGVEDCWRYAGKWWLDGRGWHRAYFRVSARTTSGGTVSLEVFRQGGNWVLSRECD